MRQLGDDLRTLERRSLDDATRGAIVSLEQRADSLGRALSGGDLADLETVVGSADREPTQQSRDVFDELSGQLRQTLQQMTWDQANSRWKLRLGDKIVFDAPRKQILRTAFVTHSAHHRAQLGVYLRMLDTPVPWSYGRSADEEPTGIM